MALQQPLLDTSAADDVESSGAKHVGESPEDAHCHGTTLTATSHIVTAVIGAGVLALPYSVAWLGWIAGPLLLAAFWALTWLNASLLARVAASVSPRPKSYSQLVHQVLGSGAAAGVAALQVTINSMASVAYTVAAAVCARTIRTILTCPGTAQSNCSGQLALWPELLGFGAVQLLASQLPTLDDAAWSSHLGAVTSLIYSLAALALSLIHAVRRQQGSATGFPAASPALKVQGVLSAMGALAFSFAFPTVLVEVQATLRQRPGGPTAGAKMQRAIATSLALALALYAGVGLAGYAAFGDAVPDNVLAIPGIGPAWVLVLANAAVVLHLLSAYQVYSQPVFAYLESAWGQASASQGKQQHHGDESPVPGAVEPGSNKAPGAEGASLRRRLAVRSTYVIVATSLAAALPCFGQILGLIGALLFWPAGVLFPVTMYLKVANPGLWRRRALVTLCTLLLFVAIGIISAAGSALVSELRKL